MPRLIDLTGRKYGRLLVLRRDGVMNGRPAWACLCDCGTERRVMAKCLRRGTTLSCGCYNKERIRETHTTHGQTNSRAYRVWQNMKNRCCDPTNSHYHLYGGRGIKVCQEWMRFENFYADMGNPPEGMTIDRIDNNGNYCRDNCRWADARVQGNNRRNNVHAVLSGERKTITQWCAVFGVKASTVKNRIRAGQAPEKALTDPIKFVARWHACR